MDRGLFYLTSPECTSTPSLTRVNVIALGNPDQLDFFSVQEVHNSSSDHIIASRACIHSIHQLEEGLKCTDQWSGWNLQSCMCNMAMQLYICTKVFPELML